MGYVLLTEADEAILRQVIESVRTGRLGRIGSLIEPERDVEEYFTPEVHVAKPATTIPGMVGDVPGQAECDIYRIDVPGGPDSDPELVQVGDLSKIVYNFSPSAVTSSWIITQRAKHGQWTIWPGPGLTRCCLKEDHPGYCTLFEVYLGAHNPSTRRWTYATTAANTKWAIDRCYGGPEPQAGARGWFQPVPDDEYGTLYECVDIDCESPGACDTDPCNGTGT